MEYTMDDGMDSQGGGSMAVGIGSQEDTMDYTMEQEEDMMDFTMSHDATNQTLSQLPDADEFSKENEEDEPPVLDFARSIGIARDHQLDDTSVDILLLMKDEVHHNFSTDLKHDHLPQLSTKAEINLDERLSICKGAARLLTSVAQNESQESLDIFIYPLLNPRNVRDMRFEPSLLRSDHEFDVKIFARRNGFDIRPQDIKLPLELVSVENNEGLEFPTDFYNFETETFEAIANEKIEVTRSSMIYLQTALKDTLTKGDEQEIWESERAHPTKFPISNHITPPLSPMPTPAPDSPLPFLPSACELPLLSDPDSLTSLDLKKIEDEIFEDDLPTPVRNQSTARVTSSSSDDRYVEPGELYSPPECIKNFDPSSSPLEMKRVVIINMKVEEILTPPKPSEDSEPKSVHFNNVVEEFLLSSRPQSGFSEPVLETKFFEEAFGESGEQAESRVEQERLVDTRNRVDVPTMDFSIPVPPWSANADNSMIGKLVKKIGIDSSMHWPGLKKLRPKLPWAPFKHDLGNITAESLDDDNTWKLFVHDSGNDEVVTSSSFTWKREGFRILREDSDDDGDDDLEKAYFPKSTEDMSSLIKKRKLEIEELNQRPKQAYQADFNTRKDTTEPFKPLVSPGVHQLISENQANIAPRNKRGRSNTKEDTSLLGGIFSAKDALNNFLEIRGVKKPKLIESSHFPITAIAPPQPPNQAILAAQSQVPESPIPKPHSPLPVPTIIAPINSISIILSSPILKNRPLLRSLQALIPTLQICERDFSAHNTTIWNPGSVIRSPITSTLTYEADIIISPTTGLILTTLQHIKQKPLPGHKTAVPIRDRLEKVSARYENLFILVASPSDGLGDSDCIAWADFVGFTLTLPASVIVNHVPIDNNAEDQSMAKYISYLIIQHQYQPSPPSPSNLELLEQESYWEIWLRRAGMNAYAAQATIVQLKEPEPRCRPGEEAYERETEIIHQSGPYGLTLFVRMGFEERLRRLGGLVGRGVLERVSRAVDQTWD